MKRMFNYLAKYWKFAVLAPLFMMIEVIVDLLQPLIMQQVIDVGIVEKDLGLIWKYSGLMILLTLVGVIGGAGSGVFATISSQNAGSDIREDLFKKVQSLTFKNIDELETGHLITRLTNDVVQIQQFFMLLMRMMIRAPFMLIGSVILTFYVSSKFGVLLLGVIAAMLLVLFIVLKSAGPLFKKVQMAVDDVNTVMLENLKGIRVVKAFVRKTYEMSRFDKVNMALRNLQVSAMRRFAIVLPIIMLMLNLGVVGVLWIGGNDVILGTSTVGEIVAVLNYITRLMFSLMMFGMIFFQISRANASSERINELLDIEPEITTSYSEDENDIDGSIEFRNVTFSYDDHCKDPALKNVSFKVSPGETLAILGATGSGKSSLVQLIPRFYDPQKGEVLLNNTNIKDIATNHLRNNISFVQQSALIFSGSIKSNIAYGQDTLTDSEIMTISEEAQAKEFILGKEGGLDAKIEQRGANLSGGQKQRLSIARALAQKPQILILDDSTSAVDVQTEVKIQNVLKSKFKETTVILVAQRISSVLDADRIIVLEDGEIVAEGNHDSLIITSDVYIDIYQSQLGTEVVS